VGESVAKIKYSAIRKISTFVCSESMKNHTPTPRVATIKVGDSDLWLNKIIKQKIKHIYNALNLN
jgi:hypothetical protein